MNLQIVVDSQYELLDSFYELSHKIGFLKLDSLIVEDWLTSRLYYDESGNICVNSYWPIQRCRDAGFNRLDFIHWQFAGFKIKEKIDKKEIDFYITDGKNKYLPCWRKNKLRPGVNLKDRITRSKNTYAKHRIGEPCFFNDKRHPGPEVSINICCVCNFQPMMILRKI